MEIADPIKPGGLKAFKIGGVASVLRGGELSIQRRILRV
jgi:hypothetical protein